VLFKDVEETQVCRKSSVKRNFLFVDADVAIDVGLGTNQAVLTVEGVKDHGFGW
jgi:hypothetical protein